jgi:hypothetical protein
MAVLNPAVTEGNYTTTLKNLRDRVLIRTGFAAQLTTLPPGTAALINDFVQSAQTQMAERFPDLVTERLYQWTMVAGTRFYSTSGDDEGATSPDFILDPRKITWVGIEDTNGTFYPLAEGIPPEAYTQIAQQGRPARYEIRQSLEVFPAPDAAYLLTVKGRPKNFTFAGDSDICTIDPELIFLLALASAKAHYRQPDAGDYFTQAVNYLGTLIGGAHGTARYVPGTKRPAPEPQPRLDAFI